MTVTNLLDIALPYTSSELRCGIKKKVKAEKRMKLAAMLNDKRAGKPVDLTKIAIMTDFATFDKKVAEWIGSLTTS